MDVFESYFSFNFQENLFIIVGDNLYYKQRKKISGEDIHEKRVYNKIDCETKLLC